MAETEGSDSINVREPLIKMLKGIQAAFDSALPPKGMREWQKRREEYATALISFAKFWDEIGCYREGMLFFELASALEDRNAGVRHPLLDAEVPKVTRPPDPSQIWRARANVIVALEALIATGVSHRDAIGKIATTNQRGLKGLAGAKSETLESALENWRKQFRKKRGVRNAEANELFEVGFALIEKRKGNTAELHAISRNRLRAARRVFSPRT